MVLLKDPWWQSPTAASEQTDLGSHFYKVGLESFCHISSYNSSPGIGMGAKQKKETGANLIRWKNAIKH